jgi:hypothetical protein
MEDHTEAKKRLDQIYALIAINEQNPFERNFHDSIFDLVDDFLARFENSNYIKLILDCSTIDVHKIGCLFTIMLWSTRDEGEKIHAWMVESYENGSQRDVEIALCVTEVYPMKDLNVFMEKLEQIKIKYPQTEILADYWLVQTKNTLPRDEMNKSVGLFEEAKQKFLKFLKNKF